MTPRAWVVMLGLWLALVVLAVWAVCRLFPGPGRDPRPGVARRTGTHELDISAVASSNVDATTTRCARGAAEDRGTARPASGVATVLKGDDL